MIISQKHILSLALASSLLLSCGPAPALEEISLSKALFELPRALNAPAASTQPGPVTRPEAASASDEDTLESLSDIYNPIREVFNPLASGVLEYTNQMMLNIETHILQNTGIMNELNTNGLFEFSGDNETEKIRMTKNSSTYRFEAWKSLDGAWLKTMDIEFTKTGDRYQGVIYNREERVDPEHRPEFRIAFDTADPQHGQSMELRAVNLDFDDPEVEDAGEDHSVATRLWLNAHQDNSTFYIAANIAYMLLGAQQDSGFGEYLTTILNGGTPMLPGQTSVKANYIYRGAVDRAEDRGAVELALVPGSNSDTETIFTDYSMGQIYKQAITSWISDNETIIGGINMMLTAAESDMQIDQASDPDDIIAALTVLNDYFASQEESAGFLDHILFVVKLVNPGYFDAQAGFVGNDELFRPEWASDIPASDALAVLSAAAVAAESFYAPMPDDNAPDF